MIGEAAFRHFKHFSVLGTVKNPAGIFSWIVWVFLKWGCARCLSIVSVSPTVDCRQHAQLEKLTVLSTQSQRNIFPCTWLQQKHSLKYLHPLANFYNHFAGVDFLLLSCGIPVLCQFIPSHRTLTNTSINTLTLLPTPHHLLSKPVPLALQLIATKNL